MCAPVKTTLSEPVKIPLPANFDEWPSCMRRRYLANALGANALGANALGANALGASALGANALGAHGTLSLVRSAS
jgi:hypothetical protein